MNGYYFYISRQMENHPQLYELLLDTTSYATAEEWYDNPWTQGHHLVSKTNQSASQVSITTDAIPHTKKEDTVSFIDAFASNIDEMFSMYSYETKRDIRVYVRDKLIDWVSLHARKFFTPSTSRSISTCLRTRGIQMADLEKFAELVSFFLEQPIKAGNKVVVWHGYTNPSRDPVCELIIKQQGVFVKQI